MSSFDGRPSSNKQRSNLLPAAISSILHFDDMRPKPTCWIWFSPVFDPPNKSAVPYEARGPE